MKSAKPCDACNRVTGNVGPWQDGRQLCGSCKVKICFDRPGFSEGLARDIADALGHAGPVTITDRRGTRIVGPRGSA